MAGRRSWLPDTGPAVELAHKIPVHDPGSLEGVAQLSDFGFKLSDVLPLSVVVAFQIGGALLELLEKWFVGFPSSDVGAGTEVTTEPLVEHGRLLSETAGAFFGVGELGPAGSAR